MEILLPRLVIDRARALPAGAAVIVANRDPAPGEVGAPRGVTVTLEILDLAAEPEGIDPASVEVSIGGAVAWAARAAGAGFSGSEEVLDDRIRLELTRAADFPSGATITVTADAESTAGDPLSAEWSFAVEDYTAPALVAAADEGRRKVRLSFSEPVALASAAFAIQAQEAPAVGAVVLTAQAEGSAVVLTLDRELSPGALYRATAEGVTDATGNEISAGAEAFFRGYVHTGPPGRVFDLWSMIPSYNRRADTGDLRLLIRAWQEVVDLSLAEVDRFGEIFDLDRASERFLDLKLAALGNPFDVSDLTLPEKRRLAGVLVEMYGRKGTAGGIIDAVRLFLGIEITIRPLGRTGMRLGSARLNDDWILGSSDPRVLYSFAVVSPVVLSVEDRERLVALVEFMRPAREHLAAVIEPAPPAERALWLLGRSRLNDDAVLR